MALDLVQARSPFYTAALPGSVLFYGLEDPADLVVWAGPVPAYNGIHMLTFLAVGPVAAWLASGAERGPQFWYSRSPSSSSWSFTCTAWRPGSPMRSGEPRPGGPSSQPASRPGPHMVAYLWWAHPRLRRQSREYADQPT